MKCTTYSIRHSRCNHGCDGQMRFWVHSGKLFIPVTGLIPFTSCWRCIVSLAYKCVTMAALLAPMINTSIVSVTSMPYPGCLVASRAMTMPTMPLSRIANQLYDIGEMFEAGGRPKRPSHLWPLSWRHLTTAFRSLSLVVRSGVNVRPVSHLA